MHIQSKRCFYTMKSLCNKLAWKGFGYKVTLNKFFEDRLQLEFPFTFAPVSTFFFLIITATYIFLHKCQ